MASKTFNSSSIAMGIAPKDALLWRGSIDTGIRSNDKGITFEEKRRNASVITPRSSSRAFALPADL
jgi:hypothetical protein